MAGILVVAEHAQGELREITGEMIGASVTLKERFGGPITVAVLSDDPAAFSDSVNFAGVDEIIEANTGVSHFDAACYEEATYQIGLKRKPGLVLFGHTANGMACSAAFAARLGAGYASDVFAVDTDSGELIATRAVYGNKVNLEMAFTGKGVVVLALRGATFSAPTEKGNATITQMAIDLTGVDSASSHVAYEAPPPSDIDIAKADFILSVGRGIQDEENLPKFQALAESIGATFGCSRPIVDSGWLSKAHQVGQSGKVASNCKLYIALGISGAVQHQFGMKHVDTIIAVNTDPNAPIFNAATYGVSMDIFEFAAAIERQFN